jgi:phenylacetate-CoA ligase
MAISRDEYLDDWETLSPGARENFLNARLRAQIKHAYQYSSAARIIMDQAGVAPADIMKVEDLPRLPITRKDDLIRLQQQQPPYGGLVSLPTADIERVFISPGPVYEIQGSDARWFSRAFWAAGFRRGDIVINTFTYHLSPAGLLMHEGLRECGATVVVAGVGNSDIQLKAMQQLGVTGFIGTPSFLMALIKKAAESGLDFNRNFKLGKAWFTGEPLASSTRNFLEQEYRIDTCQGYAVTEPGGVIAYECREKNGLHLMDDYALEIVDPQSGQPVEAGQNGEIVVTPVHNKAWGLIRFGTGDLSSLDITPCPCGRSAPRLTGIAGRIGDAVKIRGIFVVGRELEAAMAELACIARYQLRVNRHDDRDVVCLVVNLKPRCQMSDALDAQIRSAFQQRCRLKLDALEIADEGIIPPDAKKIEDRREWK